MVLFDAMKILNCTLRIRKNLKPQNGKTALPYHMEILHSLSKMKQSCITSTFLKNEYYYQSRWKQRFIINFYVIEMSI